MTMPGTASSGATPVDWLGAEDHSALGRHPLLVLDAATADTPARAAAIGERTQAIVPLVDAAGALPPIDPAPFDLMLTSRLDAPRTAYMALSARRIDTATALAWGLIHAVHPARPRGEGPGAIAD
jgi:hypothetical protein